MEEFLIPRPYTAFFPKPFSAGAVDALRTPGTLLAVGISSGMDLPTLAKHVLGLRMRYPATTFIGRIREPVSAETIHVVRRATKELRAFVHDDEPLGPMLRRLLTRPVDLSEEMCAWLEAVKYPGADVISLIRWLMRRPSRRVNVLQVASSSGHSQASLRRSLRRGGLPLPREWIRFARLLGEALELQANLETGIAAFAADHGYYDQPHITRAFVQAFGYTPAQVRRRLGWEWLAHRWLKRHGTADLD